jgi:methylthioribulose-1-phosphate dehydratase
MPRRDVKSEVNRALDGRVLTFRATRSMASFKELASLLAETGRAFHSRGWALATAGNLSAVVRRDPLVLAISRSGADKGRLTPADIVQVDGNGLPLEAEARPSDETVVHLAVVRERGAGAVLHTHSVWNTLLSEAIADAGGLSISGYEMLKALAGVDTHEHTEWVPVLENTQDYARMTRDVVRALGQHPRAHALLLRGHGLYTWGRDLVEALRHVEALEFLFEVTGRQYAASGRLPAAARVGAGGPDGDD